MGDACEFYADGTFDSAQVSYELDEKLFEEEGFVPALYYYNEDTQLLERVEGQKVKGNVLTATLKHF